jgi:flagellar export protein FliJ
MAFHFSLMALLRYRRSLEHQQETLLQKAAQSLAAAQQRLQEADRVLAAMASEDVGKLQAGVTIAELQFDLLCRSLAAGRRQELERQRLLQQEKHAQCLHSFQQARKQREAVDALRQHQFELYRQQEVRREQRRLDDMFLLRREFLRRR